VGGGSRRWQPAQAGSIRRLMPAGGHPATTPVLQMVLCVEDRASH